MTEEQPMAARTITPIRVATTGACLAAALVVVLLVLPTAMQAAPDVGALPAIVSAAQFEMHADGVPWYWCH